MTWLIYVGELTHQMVTPAVFVSLVQLSLDLSFAAAASHIQSAVWRASNWAHAIELIPWQCV